MKGLLIIEKNKGRIANVQGQFLDSHILLWKNIFCILYGKIKLLVAFNKLNFVYNNSTRERHFSNYIKRTFNQPRFVNLILAFLIVQL